MQNIKGLKAILKFGIVCGVLYISLLSSCVYKKAGLPIIEISPSGCLRTFPILDLKFDKGVIYFHLIKYNEKKGFFKYRLNDNELSKFDSLLSSVVIDSLLEKYISYRNDMQIYNTNIFYKNISKKVYYYEGEAPIEYVRLINFLISLRKKAIIETGTSVDITTRKGMELIDVPIPPMPKNDRDSIPD